MITYDKEKRMFHLRSVNTSYVFRILNDYTIEHLYYGRRLSNTVGLEYSSYKTEIKSFSSLNYESDGMMSTEMVSQEYAFFGSCDMRRPSFHAQYADGSRITKAKFVGYKISKSKPKLNGLPATYTENDDEADTLEITVRDELFGLELTYRYSVFDKYDAITRSVSAKNCGSADINISSMQSLCLDFPDDKFDFVHLCGIWASERHVEKNPLVHGSVQIESRRGSSSHNHSPFFALARKDAGEEHGEVYGFSLVYSGNFEAGVESDNYNRARAYMGINSFDFNWLLQPGESFDAPEVVMVYSDCGIGAMSRIFHKLYAERLARGYWRDRERPVLINNWEATYFDFNEQKILDLAECAKKVGIDMVVLDDGWFGKRNDDKSSLGDWFEDKEKLPGGIASLSRKVKEMGLKFGLWFEPEMVSPDSELYRAHPDWCLHIEGRGRSLCRNQLILDLSRDDVCEYIIGFMSSYLDSGNIDYIKWDMNRNMSEVGSAKLEPARQPEVAHRYMLNLYKILETLKTKYPNVLMEGCSGGGGRFDAGMMYYFDQYWTSDDTDAMERLYIQHGTSTVMPSAFMAAHISGVPNHQIGRTTPMSTRAAAAMCGQFGYELDITKMSEEELAELSSQVKYYRSIRDVIHNGKMYRLESPFCGRHTAWEYVLGNRVVLATFTNSAVPNAVARYIRLRGLEPEACYHLVGTDVFYGGDVLMNNGIRLEQKLDYIGEIFELEKV